LGDNENAIKIQMWCTLIADLLINIVKERIEKLKQRNWSFANLAGLIRQHLTLTLTFSNSFLIQKRQFWVIQMKYHSINSIYYNTEGALFSIKTHFFASLIKNNNSKKF